MDTNKEYELTTATAAQRPIVNALVEFLNQNYKPFTFRTKYGVDSLEIMIISQSDLSINGAVFNQFSALCVGYLEGYKKAITH